MSENYEYLKALYNSYSDDEIIRLYTSENLTDAAEKIALGEIKIRKLTIPSKTSETSDGVDTETQSTSNLRMRVIAKNLRFDEAIILSEFMIAEGVPSDTGSTFPQNSPFPTDLNGVVRVPEEYLGQALVVLDKFNQDSSEEQEEKANEKLVEINLSEEERKLLSELKREMAFKLLIIFSALILILFNLKSIVGFIKPYITPNIFHGLLLIASYFIMNYAMSTYNKGEFRARNGSLVTKESDSFAFWLEVIGGLIVSGLLFVYGIQYFLNINLLHM